MQIDDLGQYKYDKLRTDVSRFMKLDRKSGVNHLPKGSMTKEEYEEYCELYHKLKKVNGARK